MPHLREELWQDEAFALAEDGGSSFLQPFQHYWTPNNHIGFSVMLVAWIKLFPSGLTVVDLRALPLLLFVLAIPATFLAGRRLGGPICGLVASLLFATSTVASNFATQIRGYGPSWLFIALAFLCAMNVAQPRNATGWRIGYVLATLTAIAILPSNLYWMAVVAGGASVYLFLEARQRGGRPLVTIAILLAVPPACLLLAYSAIWSELVRVGVLDLSPWTRASLLKNWAFGTFSDIRWIVPLIGAGLLAGSWHAWTNRDSAPEARRPELVLSVLLLAGLAATVYLMPHAPFPRHLVPFLPIWFCAVAYLVCRGLSLLRCRDARLAYVLGAALLAVPLAVAKPAASCKTAPSPGTAFDYDLCHQYFRDNYHPSKVVEFWSALGRPDVPIVTDYEGYFSIAILHSPVEVFEYREYPSTSGRIPLIVAHDQASLEQMADALALGGRGYRLVSDTGYFKIYAPTR